MQFDRLERRDFIALVGGVVAWPLAARAQRARVPVTIGYLSSRSSKSDASMLDAFRGGLNATGFVEGQNVAIEYRFADGQYERLPALASELARQKVAVIVFAGLIATDAVLELVRASQIPIVFNTGSDPVKTGLVTSLNRPGGNLTGINTLVGELTAKQFGILHELIPNAATIAMLANSIREVRSALDDAREAAAALGLHLLILDANTENEIEEAFASLDQQRVDAVVVPATPFLLTKAEQLAVHAARRGVPAIYPRREFVAAGGLMSYGYHVADGYRLMGIYAGRILKGEKPADLPVVRPTKFELVINLKTAKALGLDIPDKLLALADEVIE
jgi:putative ABC transport system substrate-binding protein